MLRLIHWTATAVWTLGGKALTISNYALFCPQCSHRPSNVLSISKAPLAQQDPQNIVHAIPGRNINYLPGSIPIALHMLPFQTSLNSQSNAIEMLPDNLH